MEMESRCSTEDSLSDKEEKQQSVSVPRGWNRILEKGAILYISPNKSRIRCREDLAQYLVLEGACKCGLECPFKIDDVFNFNPNIPSRLQENESAVSPHCIVSKKFSRFFPSESSRDGLHTNVVSESNRKKKRRGQSKSGVMPVELSEEANGIIQSGMRLLPSLPSKRPRKNPNFVPNTSYSSLMRYGHASGGSQYMIASGIVEDGTKMTEDTSCDSDDVNVATANHGPYLNRNNRLAMAGTTISKSAALALSDNRSIMSTTKSAIFPYASQEQASYPTSVIGDTPSSQGLLTEHRGVTGKGLTSPDNALLRGEPLLNSSREDFRLPTVNSTSSTAEHTTNVVSLGLASCVAMSVSASVESDVDRHSRSNNFASNRLSVKMAGTVNSQNLSSVTDTSILSKNTSMHSAPVKARTKNTIRRKPNSKASDSRTKQTRGDRAKSMESKEPAGQGTDVAVSSGTLLWNSLPGGTMSTQFTTPSATNFQTRASLDPSALQYSSKEAVVTHPRLSTSSLHNSEAILRPPDSVTADPNNTRVMQTSNMHENVKESNWAHCGMYKVGPQNPNVSMAGMAPSSGIRSPQQREHLSTVDHSMEPQCMPQHRKGASANSIDHTSGESMDFNKGTCNLGNNTEVYNYNHRKLPKIGSVMDSVGAEVPPNITLSPSLSNSLLHKENDNRLLLPLTKAGGPIPSSLNGITATSKQTNNTGSSENVQHAMGTSAKGNEKEAELKQQAKANVYWCSQGSKPEQSPLSPTLNATLPPQIAVVSRESSNLNLGSKKPSTAKSWSKSQPGHRRALSSPTPALTSPPAGTRSISLDHNTSFSDSQISPQPSRTISQHLQPNTLLMNLPSTSNTSSQRELLNAPLPLNTQSQGVPGQSSTYMLQSQDANNATSVGQPMVLLRLVSQASSVSKMTTTPSSANSTQTHVLPSSYGIPVSQPMYHSQLANYAMPSTPGNPGQVFIMGNTHASQALQNLALQNNQGTKEEGMGSLVYQTGYSAHAIRSPTASINYAGIPLQLMTIAGSPVVARPQGQAATKADTYTAMLQYYQKQMELSRIRGGQVLAPAPGLIRPLATQVSPTFGNSYIRIAPAFGGVPTKDTLVQSKLTRNLSDPLQPSSTTLMVGDKGKPSTTSGVTHFQDGQNNNQVGHSTKDTRNTNSPLSPKFEFSRLKHSSYHNSQPAVDTKLNLSDQTNSRTSVSNLSSYPVSPASSPETGQTHRNAPISEMQTISSPHRSDSSVKSRSPLILGRSPSNTSQATSSSSNMVTTIFPSSENSHPYDIVKPADCVGLTNSTDHEAMHNLSQGRVSVRPTDYQVSKQFPAKNPGELNQVYQNTKTKNESAAVAVPKSPDDLQTSDGARSKMNVSNDLVLPAHHTKYERDIPDNSLSKSQAYSSSQASIDQVGKDGNQARRSSCPPIDRSFSNVRTNNVMASIDLQGKPDLNLEGKDDSSCLGMSKSFSPDSGNISINDGNDVKSADMELTSECISGVGENQLTTKSQESEEMSLQCLEDCSHISGDSCAPSPKCPSKNSPIYFSEAKSKLLQVGDLVWGEFNGFPSWPGKIVSENDINKSAPEPGKVWVQWFGDRCFEQVNQGDLKTLNEGLRNWNGPGRKQKDSDEKRTTDHFEQAVYEALREADGISPITSNHLSTVQPKSRGRGRKKKGK